MDVFELHFSGFFAVGVLHDGTIELRLRGRLPALPEAQRVPVYDFEIYLPHGREAIGTVCLRVGDSGLIDYAGHVGYAIEPEYRGHHYAERAVRLILPLAWRHGMERLLITADPGNIASRRTCERLGAELLDIADVPPSCELYKGGARRKARYIIKRRKMEENADV